MFYFIRNTVYKEEYKNCTFTWISFHVSGLRQMGLQWEKWITKIEISENQDCKRYRESRGYNNDGDLNISFFD